MRGPWSSLLFVLPLLGLYEVGLDRFQDLGALRTGADLWVRQALTGIGASPIERWLPMAILIGLLVAWQLIDRSYWRLRLGDLVGMLAESLVLAVGLVGLSKLVDLGFDRLEGGLLLANGPGPSDQRLALAVGFLGAGIYEEAIFRLALVPLLYGVLRSLQTPAILASTLAVTGSALLFSMAHHVGGPGEAFTWFAFVFRWLAGVYFAWVFVLRGFGVAVGTHIAYDMLVGCVGWHL
ncbi:CPBP family glutamic-type intramembrane protease [soil metagenome]